MRNRDREEGREKASGKQEMLIKKGYSTLCVESRQLHFFSRGDSTSSQTRILRLEGIDRGKHKQGKNRERERELGEKERQRQKERKRKR